ncbi:hypothetical protein ES703_92824 [subsurface metagenome]
MFIAVISRVPGWALSEYLHEASVWRRALPLYSVEESTVILMVMPITVNWTSLLLIGNVSLKDKGTVFSTPDTAALQPMKHNEPIIKTSHRTNAVILNALLFLFLNNFI